VDWDEVTAKLARLETDCKTSWDHLRAVVKHDMAPSLKSKCVTVVVPLTRTDVFTIVFTVVV